MPKVISLTLPGTPPVKLVYREESEFEKNWEDIKNKVGSDTTLVIDNVCCVNMLYVMIAEIVNEEEG